MYLNLFASYNTFKNKTNEVTVLNNLFSLVIQNCYLICLVFTTTFQSNHLKKYLAAGGRHSTDMYANSFNTSMKHWWYHFSAMEGPYGCFFLYGILVLSQIDTHMPLSGGIFEKIDHIRKNKWNELNTQGRLNKKLVKTLWL